MKLVYQYMVFFFNSQTTSYHLHPLQVDNCDRNSRLVVDEDDNVKSGLKGLINRTYRCLAGQVLLLISHVVCLCVFQHRPVYVEVSEIFILVPALLGLKGNLEMTLASRLSTQVSSLLTFRYLLNRWLGCILVSSAISLCISHDPTNFGKQSRNKNWQSITILKKT